MPILNTEKVAARLDEIIDKRLTTKEQLAIDHGISTKTLWKATTGKTITCQSVKKIAAALGCKPESLR